LQNEDNLSAFERGVYAVVASIPCGCVSTYSRIAYTIGAAGAARAVGNALNKNIYADVPCHRVVQSDGGVGGYAWGEKNKISMLLREGVVVANGRIDLKKYGIRFNT